jgi:hypothetical protein
MRRACVTALVSFVSGCCVSPQQAARMQSELVAQNLALAEPDMREAAERRGAILLPLTALHLRIPSCDTSGISELLRSEFPPPDPLGRCAEWAPGGKFFRIVSDREKPKLAVVVQEHDRLYARIARRGNKLFVLEPRVSPQEVREVTECECNGMPYVVNISQFAFVMDDIESPEIERIAVPMTEFAIAWKCKLILATQDSAERARLASCGPRVRPR